MPLLAFQRAFLLISHQLLDEDEIGVTAGFYQECISHGNHAFSNVVPNQKFRTM